MLDLPIDALRVQRYQLSHGFAPQGCLESDTQHQKVVQPEKYVNHVITSLTLR